MTRLDLTPLAVATLALGLGSCGKDPGGGDDGMAMSAGITVGAGTAGDDGGTAADDGGDETGDKLDVAGGGDGGPPGCNNGDVGCTDQIDLLFVIDNSGTMGQEQLNLARNFPLLIERLENLQDSAGNPVNPDVQIMVTTSDFGNPLCTQFEPEGYDPAEGAPISTPCTGRLGDFTDLTGTVAVPEACTNVCPNDAAPSDPFITFSGGVSNVNDVPEVDISGDGMPDSDVAQALACIGPQGINGCGYESQLESMMQALDPNATWNQGDKPFLRPNALLAIAIITDEADCSIKNYSIMDDETFQETNPSNNNKQASSAICWNAGVECTGPDASGTYSECHSRAGEDMQPITRYTNYLINQLRGVEKKEVVMLGILGVPEVTEHNAAAPFQPTAGGVLSLVYRDWAEGEYPTGDILPAEFASGTTAADKQFDFGIGPGCTGGDAVSGFTGQAIPPVRIKEVCEELNIDDTDEGIRCCIESICDDDFSAAIGCLTGIIGQALVPAG
jgi:hypothetical protein